MKFKQLPLSFARNLKRMAEGEVLNASEIKAKALCKHFVEDGLVQEIPTGAKRFRYACNNATALANYLKVHYSITSLENYIQLTLDDEVSGSDSLQATLSTKTFRSASLQGFFLKIFGTKVRLSGADLPSLQNGVELFVHDNSTLEIDPHALIIGIENPECFVHFQQLRHLFHSRPCVVVMRYLSLSPVRWMQTIENEYVHFGDFDPAGVAIFVHEFLKVLGPDRASFFVPESIESLLKNYGSVELYEKQKHLLNSIDSHTHSSLTELFHLFSVYGRGVEQERMLSL